MDPDYKSIIGAVIDGIIAIDERGIIEMLNTAAERIFGYTADELIGRNVKMLVPEPHHDRHDGYIQRYLRTKETRIIGIAREVMGQRRDGSTFPMDIAVSEVARKGGCQFVAVVRDTSAYHREKAQLRESLTESEERFRQLAEQDLQHANDALEQRVEERTAELKHANQALERHIAEQKQAEQALRESETHLRTLAQISPAGIFRTDAKGDCVYVNPSWCEIAGLTPEEAYGQGWAKGLHPEDRERVFEEWYRTTSEQHPYQSECRFRRRNGVTTWVYAQAVAERDSDGNVTGYVGTMMDITERKQIQERLEYLAHHDVLTGLANRMLFKDRLEHALARAQRSQRLLALLFLDLDDFKDINDALGHDIGDRFLQALSRRLTDNMREGDTVARLGGDEFALLLEDIARVADVAPIAEKVLAALSGTFVVDDRELSVTISIGISLYPDDAEDAPTLLQHADNAMYRAKQEKGNAYCFYTAGLAPGPSDG